MCVRAEWAGSRRRALLHGLPGQRGSTDHGLVRAHGDCCPGADPRPLSAGVGASASARRARGRAVIYRCAGCGEPLPVNPFDADPLLRRLIFTSAPYRMVRKSDGGGTGCPMPECGWGPPTARTGWGRRCRQQRGNTLPRWRAQQMIEHGGARGRCPDSPEEGRDMTKTNNNSSSDGAASADGWSRASAPAGGSRAAGVAGAESHGRHQPKAGRRRPAVGRPGGPSPRSSPPPPS